LRAYVVIREGSGRLLGSGDNQSILLDITLQNFGQTPGYDFTTWLKWAVTTGGPGPLPFGPPIPLQDRTGASIIGPGQIVQITAFVSTDDNMVQMLLSGAYILYAWGGARYTDTFGKVWNFDFHDSITGPFRAPNTWALSPHSVGYHETSDDG
jgi:hypothetical protein